MQNRGIPSWRRIRERRLAGGVNHFTGNNLVARMKSDGPWDLRGLRPEVRAAAREAACRSGMTVGEWLNTLIRSAEEREGGSRRSVYSDWSERNYEPRGFYSDDRESDVNADIEYDERGYDRHQKQEWERHAGGQGPTNRGEQRRRPSREETWERGFGDEDLNGVGHRQKSPRRGPETRQFRDQPERPRVHYYDEPEFDGVLRQGQKTHRQVRPQKSSRACARRAPRSTRSAPKPVAPRRGPGMGRAMA